MLYKLSTGFFNMKTSGMLAEATKTEVHYTAVDSSVRTVKSYSLKEAQNLRDSLIRQGAIASELRISYAN